MSIAKAILTIPGAVGAMVENAVYAQTGNAKTAEAVGQIAKWGTIVATADVISGTVEVAAEVAMGLAIDRCVETRIEEVGTAVLVPVLFVASQKNDNGSGSTYNGNTQIGSQNALST